MFKDFKILWILLFLWILMQRKPDLTQRAFVLQCFWFVLCPESISQGGSVSWPPSPWGQDKPAGNFYIAFLHSASDAPDLSISLSVNGGSWQKIRKKTEAQKYPVMSPKHVHVPELREELPRGNKKREICLPSVWNTGLAGVIIDPGLKQKILGGSGYHNSLFLFLLSSANRVGRKGGRSCCCSPQWQEHPELSPVPHSDFSKPRKNTKEAHGFIIYGLFPTITNRKHLQGEGAARLLSEMSMKPRRKGTKCSNYRGLLWPSAIIKYS